jgi:predicted amidohydrolase YtcJ
MIKTSIVRHFLINTAFFTALVGCADSQGPAPAELVLDNGRIYTLDSEQPWAEAVAIREGRFVFVGGNEEAAAYVGENTQVIDLGGKMAMPGINDTHSHPWQGGVKLLYQCNFPFSATPDEIAVIVKGCVSANPDAEWIKGGQWTSDFFDIHDLGSPRQWLDAISGDTAIFFEDDSAHNAWVNSKALELAGIGRDVPDPPGGFFLRDADGGPNGVLLETAKPLVEKAVPDLSPAENLAGLARAVEEANAFGITGFAEARTPPEISAVYQQLDSEGRLTVHATTYLQTPPGPRSDSLDVAPLVEIAERHASGRVHTRFAKIFLDGVPTSSRTASMLAPYVVNEEYPEETRGSLLIEPEALAEDVTKLDAAGFTVKIHTAGDGSVRTALDAIEAARKANGNQNLPHSLGHAGYVDPTDLPRFSELNVTAEFSPYLWYPRPIIDSVVGAVGERGSRYWPTRDLLATGARLSIGSDWPSAAADMNPWPAMEALVTRRNPYQDGTESFWPEQAVSLQEAIKIFTLTGAKAHQLDGLTGSIEPGKSADLIVLDRQLFDIPIEDISDTRVEQTFFAGERVHSQPGDS